MNITCYIYIIQVMLPLNVYFYYHYTSHAVIESLFLVMTMNHGHKYLRTGTGLSKGQATFLSSDRSHEFQNLHREKVVIARKF